MNADGAPGTGTIRVQVEGDSHDRMPDRVSLTKTLVEEPASEDSRGSGRFGRPLRDGTFTVAVYHDTASSSQPCRLLLSLPQVRSQGFPTSDPSAEGLSNPHPGELMLPR